MLGGEGKNYRLKNKAVTEKGIVFMVHSIFGKFLAEVFHQRLFRVYLPLFNIFNSKLLFFP